MPGLLIATCVSLDARLVTIGTRGAALCCAHAALAKHKTAAEISALFRNLALISLL
jgi:hypothetical protein